MPIDHASVAVKSIAASKDKYAKALKPLGYKVSMEFENQAVGFAYKCSALFGFIKFDKPDFWLAQRAENAPLHLAFSATKQQVDQFHEAALAAGFKDNGAPGPRPQYHKGYYAAFVIDDDGNNIEAVCHRG